MKSYWTFQNTSVIIVNKDKRFVYNNNCIRKYFELSCINDRLFHHCFLNVNHSTEIALGLKDCFRTRTHQLVQLTSAIYLFDYSNETH